MTSCSTVSCGGGVTQWALKNNNPFYFKPSPVFGEGTLVVKMERLLFSFNKVVNSRKSKRTDIGSELNCKIETKKHQIRQAITASQSNCKAVN